MASSNNMGFIFLFLCISSIQVSAETILLVHVAYLHNPQSLMATPNGVSCCQNSSPVGVFGCRSSCDPVIEVCLLGTASSQCEQTFTSSLIPGGVPDTSFGSRIGNMSNPMVIHVPSWSPLSRYRVTAYDGGNRQHIIGQMVVQPNATDIGPDSLHVQFHQASMKYYRTGVTLTTNYKVFRCDTSGHQKCDDNGHQVCPMPYYGRDCSLLCYIEPVLGVRHGACLTGIAPMCEKDWTGVHCSEAAGACASIQCMNGGRCVSDTSVPIGTFRCECSKGWTGHLCEHNDVCALAPCYHGNCSNHNDIAICHCEDGWSGPACNMFDHCTNAPCLNGGQCLTTAVGTYCHCTQDWTGFNCETKIDQCLKHPCKNNAICVNGLHDYNCVCPSGWIGHDCDVDINECQTNQTPCSGHGVCFNLAGSFTCRCTSGWAGTVCDHKVCPTGYTGVNCTEISSCANFGFKVQTESGYICQCPYGWQGLRCEVDEDECAVPVTCQNNGTCINRPGTFICACVSGWHGHKCETDIDECISYPCLHGTCVNKNAGYDCNCQNGWTGSHCDTDIDECENTTCNNNGTCVNFAGDFRCVCPDGFGGNLCENNIDECANVTCANYGLCIDGINSFVCKCPVGYAGKLCEVDIDECMSSPCIHGTCIDRVGKYSCQCTSGWSGTDCNQDINECEFSPCENGANCTNYPGKYGCTCVVGFVGAQCETNVDDCMSSPCLNNGTCQDLVNDFSCTCFGQFTGRRCDVYNFCAYSPCKHGQCVMTDNTPTCQCDVGWEGVACHTDVDECAGPAPCATAMTCVNTPGSYECDACNMTYCGVNGTCVVSNNVPTCLCGSGWTGKDCSHEDLCAGNPCSSHLECVNTFDGYTCHHHHSKDLCASTPCKNGGTCEFHPFYTPPQYECHCATGWRGIACDVDIDECDVSPCSSDHTCVNTAGGFACVKRVVKRSLLVPMTVAGTVTLKVDRVIGKTELSTLRDQLVTLTCKSVCDSASCSLNIPSYVIQSRYATSTLSIVAKCGNDVINKETLRDVLGSASIWTIT